MSKVEKLEELLELAGHTHHAVYHKEDGADDDWATWYSHWLLNHTDFSEILGSTLIRSHLTSFLVDVDKRYREESPKERWQFWYAQQLLNTEKDA